MKRLIDLAMVNNKLKYPNFPDHARPKPKYTDKTSNGLTKCVIDFLNYSGHQAERINSGGRMKDGRQTYTNVLGHLVTIGSTQWVYGTGTKGTADVSSTINGKSVKIEIKVGKDQQSGAQERYQQQVERAGGTYIIARDFETFLHWYDGFIKRC